MKSNVIRVDNHGHGLEELKREVGKVAVYEEIGERDTLDLQLLAEELFSLLQCLDDEVEADVWIECQDHTCEIKMSTKTSLDKEERYRLISSSTSGKNEITKSFVGRVRNTLEEALASESDHEYFLVPQELAADLPQETVEDQEWDGIERKVMRAISDSVRISIRSRRIEMVITKKYA